MNFTEALDALYKGKKIRRKSWKSKHAYRMKADKSRSFGMTQEKHIVLSPEDFQADGWKPLKKIRLNRKEEEFLENALRPYTGSYDIAIDKKIGDENQYYLDIILFPHNDSDGWVERFCLPLSEIN